MIEGSETIQYTSYADTRIAVNSMANFSTTGGIVKIGNELIKYTAIEDQDFVGCIRGYAGTIASPHWRAVPVVKYSNSITFNIQFFPDIPVDFIEYTFNIDKVDLMPEDKTPLPLPG